jgi:hypothetical protein
MKIHLFIFSFCIAIISTSCKKENSTPEPEANVEGTWYLYNTTGGFAGVNYLYEPGEIQWEINQDSIHVDHLNPQAPHTLLGDGSYGLEIQNLDSLSLIILNGAEIGAYTFDLHNLYLEERFVDGFYYHFKR